MHEKLVKWELPPHYWGEHWDDWYVFLGRNRDSDLVASTNFEAAIEELGGESGTVQIVRENHWVVGWVEWIAIHQDDSASLKKASDMLDQLDDYPALDEEKLSDRQVEAEDESWESCDSGDFLDVLKQADYDDRQDITGLTDAMLETFDIDLDQYYEDRIDEISDEELYTLFTDSGGYYEMEGSGVYARIPDFSECEGELRDLIRDMTLEERKHYGLRLGVEEYLTVINED